jgi:hypothetical protein
MTDTSPFPPEPDEPGSPLVPEPESEAVETFPPEHGSQAREAFPPEPDEPGSPLPPE